MLGDEARLCLAEQHPAILHELRVVRLGCERRVGCLDAVEPDLTDAVPAGSGRRPLFDHAEPEAADTGQLLHEFGVRSHPVLEERFTSELGMATDEADALDHRVLVFISRTP